MFYLKFEIEGEAQARGDNDCCCNLNYYWDSKIFYSNILFNKVFR